MRTKVTTFMALGYGQPPGGYAPPQGPPTYGPPAQPGYAQPQYAPPPQPAYPPAYPPQQNYPQPFRPTKPLKAILPPLLITLVAMILLVVALATPWYTVSSKSTGETSGEYKMDLSFGGTNTETKYSGQTMTQTTSWDKYTDDYKKGHDGKSPSLPGVYMAAMALGIIAFVLALVSFILIIVDWVGKLPQNLAKLLPIFILVGAVMGFVAIGYFAAAHTGAITAEMSSSSSDPGPHNSFIGSDTRNNSTYSWGPGIGWILEIVGAILLIIGFVLPFINKPRPKPAQYPGQPGQYQAAPPQMYQQAPQQGYAPPPGPPGYMPPPGPPQQPGYGPPPQY